MIKTFIHKGLEDFFYSGSTKGIQAKHTKRLRLILSVLDAATEIKDLNFPGSDLHQLKGQMKGLWSIKVNANWRITFKFKDGNIYITNYQDYH